MERLSWRGVKSRVEAWLSFVLLAAFLYAAASLVVIGFSASSIGDWFRLGLWVFLAAGVGWQCVGIVRGRGAGGPVPPVVAPGDVAVADVEASVASTSDRVSAVKVLRERYPGLGLRDAADLVDGVLGGDSR